MEKFAVKNSSFCKLNNIGIDILYINHQIFIDNNIIITADIIVQLLKCSNVFFNNKITL